MSDQDSGVFNRSEELIFTVMFLLVAACLMAIFAVGVVGQDPEDCRVVIDVEDPAPEPIPEGCEVTFSITVEDGAPPPTW